MAPVQTPDVGYEWMIAALGCRCHRQFRRELAPSSAQCCVFASTDTVTQIKLLQEKRQVAPTLNDFEKVLSKGGIPHWQELQAQLAARGELALDWLDRCDFHALSEDFLEQTVAAGIAYWFQGKSDLIVSAIRTWVVEDRAFNSPIDRAVFLAFC